MLWMKDDYVSELLLYEGINFEFINNIVYTGGWEEGRIYSAHFPSVIFHELQEERWEA